MTGTEKRLLITSPLFYLFHQLLLWSVNVSSGMPATTEQVILPHPLLSPSCPQFKTSKCPNRIDPNLNPTLQPFLSSEESHFLLPNMHWRVCMKEEMLDRRQRKRIRAWARIRCSLIYNWQCFSVEKPPLICCLITNFHHHVQIPLRGFCGLFARCLCCLHCKFAFQKRHLTSRPQLATQNVFFFCLTLCLSTSLYQ